MNTFGPAGALCQPIPTNAPLGDLTLPFDDQTEVICTHSSGSGSHSGPIAYYALDLANAYEQPPAVVRASAEGTAYVFGDATGKTCPQPQGRPASAEPSTCGDSWGNRIKILHENGYFSFYTHLERALVNTGDHVRQGDPIGVMGWTGLAGHRHVHWSVQRLPGKNSSEWQQQILSYVGESVPFRFSAGQNGVRQSFDSSKIICAHAGIGHAPESQQPRFRGVVRGK